jgi:hypothetical protein
LVHVATHFFVVRSQTGVTAGQSLVFVHCTHLSVVRSQTGVLPTQAVVSAAVH